MTIYFNVTDAIGTGPNHGITRTERRLASALSARQGVDFALVREGRLWRADRDAAKKYLERSDEDRTPRVERFGDRRAPSRQARRAQLGSLRRSIASTANAVALEPLRARPRDTLVSVGLDWERRMPDLADRHVFASGGRFVSMCYDLIPVDHPEWLFPPDPDGFRQYLRRMTRVADRVLCISQCTQRDLLRHFPELGVDRAPVIRLGADAVMSTRPEHDRFAAALFDGEPYAIYCATVDRRKNHQLLYRAMREMVRAGIGGNIAFVGRTGSGTDDLIDSLRHDRLVVGRIAHVTNCDDGHLAALYRHAACAVYPSLYEGWGLGVTEALAHGKPCLIATGSSLGEAGLGVCRELDPLRTGPWVDAMAEYLSDPPELPPLDLPTWDEAADQLLELVAT